MAVLRQAAPAFTATAVVDGTFQRIQLSDYKGKYVVLFFYPMDFTFVCPTELIAFSDRVEEFKALNCAVLACSTDTKYTHLAWINQPRKQGGLGGIKFPLLADPTKAMASAYNVLIRNEKDDAVGVALRGLFLIDPEGILRHMTINDLPIGRNVDEVLRLLQAFQFHKMHGEACPANWHPGSKTMVTGKETKTYVSASKKQKVAP